MKGFSISLRKRGKALKIIEINKDIKRLVDENDGYCPCALVKDKDTKCICKEFREQTTPGACHCGRFEKVEVSDND